MTTSFVSSVVQEHRPDLSKYETIYKHFHSHPELSNQEHNTAARIVSHLKQISTDFDVRSEIGGTGIVALYRTGEGPRVLLRADIDALPIQEATGLEYASGARMRDIDGTEKPVMHACGHDMHITCLLGAAELLVAARDSWSGTLILAFQPAEERGTGAQGMVDDGMYDSQVHNVPIPDVCIGGHITPDRSGTIGTRRGVMASSADSLRITLHGRGGHASQPHKLVDPIVLAASTITRLQTIVSREVNPADHAVLTVASIQAGNAENVVVDDAEMAIDIRAMNDKTRSRLLDSMRRVVEAESMASGAIKPPTFVPTRTFPLTVNDDIATARLEKMYAAHFSTTKDDYDPNTPPLGFSEDFTILGTHVKRPTVFFKYGATDPALWVGSQAGTHKIPIPTNHSAKFAPAIQPTMRIGIDAYAIGALTWLAKGATDHL